MDDDNQNGEGASAMESAQVQETEQAQEERKFTQADIDRILAKERQKYERKYAKPPTKQEKGESTEHDPSADILEKVTGRLSKMEELLIQQTQKAEALERETKLQAAIAGVELAPADLETVKTLYESTGDLNRVKVLASRLADTSVPPNSDKGFNEPGNGVNRNIGELPPNVNDLTKDDVARLRAEGRLREVIEKANGVGAGAVFRPKSFRSKN